MSQNTLLKKKSPKGFAPQDPAIQKELKTLMRANTGMSLLSFALDWGLILGLAIFSTWTFHQFGINALSIVVYLFAITLIASRQRALECLIHEAVHVNLSPNMKFNDRLAWILAALPLGHNVITERRSHLIGHHKYFWDLERDPDYRRYRQIGIDRLPAHSYRELLYILTEGFIPYIKSTVPAFFLPQHEEIKTKYLRLAFWVLALLLSIVMNILIPLVFYWFVPFFTMLMLIRYIGEASEHAALECTDEFGTTRNNLGWFNKAFIHPHGDAYHLIHHLYPKIPFYRAARAHRLLLQDSTYREVGHHCGGLVIRQANRQATIEELAGLREL